MWKQGDLRPTVSAAACVRTTGVKVGVSVHAIGLYLNLMLPGSPIPSHVERQVGPFRKETAPCGDIRFWVLRQNPSCPRFLKLGTAGHASPSPDKVNKGHLADGVV